MSSEQMAEIPLEAEEEQVEYGSHREPGMAGPHADYIMRSVERWRLRGEGIVRG